jgi:hypothetical protein
MVKALNLFDPRRIGNITSPNSDKYAMCSVSNAAHGVRL